MIRQVLLIGVAGACGACARYGLTNAVHSFVGRDLPWGTICVNVLGCLLFGLFTGLLDERLALSTEVKAILLTGFMGAFTTFSTYMYETHQMLEDGRWIHAAGHMTLQNAVGFGAIILGLAISRIGS
jgi:fluoride exporter